MRKGFKPAAMITAALKVGGPTPVGIVVGCPEERETLDALIGSLGVRHRVYAKWSEKAKLPTERELKELRAAELAAKGEGPHESIGSAARRNARGSRPMGEYTHLEQKMSARIRELERALRAADELTDAEPTS